jgi:hypothetical protein
MQVCSICKKLKVVPGDIEDYKKLAHYHYRDSRVGPFTGIFALKPCLNLPGLIKSIAVGVIVYSMPTPGSQLRNIATDNLFTGFDRSTQLALINKNFRCIARVIIEPRFRGLGLATRLVRETMPQANVPIIEALAVMGRVNPFFEKAGMKAYHAPIPERCVKLIEAFSLVGIEQNHLIDADLVNKKLSFLRWSKADFIEKHIRHFLMSYGRRRDMPAGHQRTKFILSKLTYRPVYYIWFNPTRLGEGRAVAGYV